MKFIALNKSFLFSIVILIVFVFQTNGQNLKENSINYISPKPGSKYIMPGNNIAIRHGDPFDIGVTRTSVFEITNERNENIRGHLVLSDDNRTLIFLPQKTFELGSQINVKLLPGLQTKSGIFITPIQFSFTIASQLLTIDNQFIDKYIREESTHTQNSPIRSKLDSIENNYPEGYAFANILLDSCPHDGYYFYTPNDHWNMFPETLPYCNIIDQYGIPIYYRKFQERVYDLKPQPGGYLSCYSFHPYWGHILMDSSYNQLDIYKMQNGYTYTDFHEFQLLENGHSFIMTFDTQLVDMSEIVPDGDSAAIVSGFVFQELDANKNVVFQWRSWDHFEITETGPEVDLTEEMIDYVHGNTIEIESDTSLLISSRNFHEITKIDRNSGEIIWRLGGSQNQFEFINDTLGFSRQHDCRRNADGHVTLYDNGKYHPDPKYSSALEYDIDPINMTATLVNRYRHDPDIYGMAMGNAFWTPEESIVVDWGTSSRGITEFDDDGNSIFEIRFHGMSYRAYRQPWRTNRFYFENDTLQFGSIWMEDSLTNTISIFNDQNEDLVLTSYHSHTNHFIIENTFPLTVPANNSISLEISFKPNSAGTFEDIITLNSDINTEELVQRIAQQLQVIGQATEEQSIGEIAGNRFRVFPNPTIDRVKVSFDTSIDNVTVFVYSVAGQNIKEVFYKQTSDFEIDFTSFEKGIYFLKIRSANLGESGVLKIVKK